MQAAELDLPHLAMEDAGFFEDPAARFAEARRHHPWLATCSFGYVITQYAAIRELMNHEDRMRMSHPDTVRLLGAEGTSWGRFLQDSIQAQNGETHRKLRQILAPAFTPREANRHRDLMRQVIGRLLDDWAPMGEFDFEEFASHFPITVMCTIIGASPDDLPRLRSSLKTLGLGGSMEPGYLPQLQEAYLVLDAFVRDLVAQRRSEGVGSRDDLLDRLLEFTEAGDLSDDDLCNLLIFLFTAGFDTSKNLLTLIMYALLDRPGDYAQCASDPAFCRRVVNETLRFHGIASLPRVLREDLEFRGVHFPMDTMIFLPWGAVGRDEGLVENPDSFDPHRSENNTHVAFGLGPHICLGQFLARAQTEEALHMIAGRIRNPRLAGAVGWREFIGAWGIRGLPIRFEPGDVGAEPDKVSRT